jgi:phosphoglycerate dehydrogenase-like enzyme
MDRYPLERIREKGMVLTKGSGAGAVLIAEYAVLCVLSAAKSHPFFQESSARRVWPGQRPGGVELAGSWALVHGYGTIGRAVAERLRAFGVYSPVRGARSRVRPTCLPRRSGELGSESLTGSCSRPR